MNEIADGMPAPEAARTMPIASSALVIVIAVTWSAVVVGERADLHRVVALGFLWRHRATGVVAVAARADASAHHRGDAVGRRGRADLLGE